MCVLLGVGIGLQEVRLKAAVPNLFGTRDRIHGRQFFHRRGWEERGWFQDDSGALLLYCALYFYCYYRIMIYNAIIIQLAVNTESVGALNLFSCSSMVPSGGDGRIACRSPPAVWPSFCQVTDWYWPGG